jgi:RHS repeat-associated protein
MSLLQEYRLTSRFYADDHLYSPAALTTWTGALVERYEYDAYGSPYILEPNFAADPDGKSDYGNPYLFTGRRVDFLDNGSLTLQYNRHRYYDYYTGRWTTQDPLGINARCTSKSLSVGLQGCIEGLNLYEYAASRPPSVDDPMGLTVCDTTVGNQFNPWPGMSWQPPTEQESKAMLYRKARDWFIRTEHWRDMLDDWYCETGSAPRTYTGIDEVHNKDIANNSGFEELLAAWVAKNFCGTKLKESDFWSVDSGDFHWEYHYPDCHAGGRAAYTDATDFLGSYDAYLTVTKNEDCLLDISVTAKNKTNWKSACKTVQSIGYYCSYSNHARNAGPYVPSRGGDFEQEYVFDVKDVPITWKCSLCAAP